MTRGSCAIMGLLKHYAVLNSAAEAGGEVGHETSPDLAGVDPGTIREYLTILLRSDDRGTTRLERTGQHDWTDLAPAKVETAQNSSEEGEAG